MKISHRRTHTTLVVSLMGALALLMTSVTASSAATSMTAGEGFHVEVYGSGGGAGGNGQDNGLEGCQSYRSAVFELAFPNPLQSIEGRTGPATVSLAFDGDWFEGPSGTYLPGDFDPPPAPNGCPISSVGDWIPVSWTSILVTGTGTSPVVCSYTPGSGAPPSGGRFKRVPTVVLPAPNIQDIPIDSVYTIEFPCPQLNKTFTATAHLAVTNALPPGATTPPCAPPAVSISCTLHQATLTAP